MTLEYVNFIHSDNTTTTQYNPNYDSCFRLAKWDENYHDAVIVFSVSVYSYPDKEPLKYVYRNINHEIIDKRTADFMMSFYQ